MYPQVSGGTTPAAGQASYDAQFSSVVVQQPTPAAPGVPMVPGQPVTWMPPPGSIQGCPPGLEYLSHLDQVVIKQEASLIEVLVGWEAKNKFRLLNSMGQQIYFATEESGMCQRQCCGPSRGFIYHFTDNANQEVFRVRRDFRCCTGLTCCPCEMCRYYGVCEDRNGQVLGYISNLCFCCSPRFGIYDEQRRLVAEVKGPCCPCQCVCGCTADINFPVIDVGNHTEIGTIKKQWTGFFKDMVTDCDNFAVLFPVNTEVKKKALMIGAVFIIDMMLYEHSQDSGGAGAAGAY